MSNGEATPKARIATTATVRAADHEVLPELEPWREVGWIFRDDGCMAVERRGKETRARNVEY